jgi:hypothetical protein
MIIPQRLTKVASLSSPDMIKLLLSHQETGDLDKVISNLRIKAQPFLPSASNRRYPVISP